jgi:hypothetical protein
MKVTKILFQSSLFKPPSYLIERHMGPNPEWQYFHFDDEELFDYIEQNPIEEFPNSLEIAKTLKGPHRTDFFRYYYLYLNGGVYLDYDAVLNVPLNDIVKNYNFFTVKSILNNDSVFNGFIGAEPKNTIIYQALKAAYNANVKSGETEYFYNCITLMTIINNYKQVLQDLFVNYETIFNSKCKLFTEKLVRIVDGVKITYSDLDESKRITKPETGNSYSIVVDDDNEILVTHHYITKDIYPETPFPDRHPTSVGATRIGITLDLPVKIQDLYSNGIRQNVYYLGELLVNIGYDFYFIINKSYNEEIIEKSFYDNRFKYIKYNRILTMNFDVVVSIGFEMDLSILKYLRQMKTKIVSYNCGNNYIIDSECMLFSQHPAKNNQINYIRPKAYVPYDIIWSIPQMTNTNQYYWQTLMRAKCIEVPFIWSDKSIHLIQLSENKKYEELLYRNRGPEKKLVIFEPNISIMKWCGPSLLSCENAYRSLENKSMISGVFVNNISGRDTDSSINKFNLDAFTIYVNNFDLCADKKVTIEGRFNTLAFMNAYGDIAVSHQWENNLNYLYFDLAWMGWPIVHNASLCRDVGYYYPEFNYEEGGNKIIEAIKTHEENKDEYLERNRRVIDKYLPTNRELQQKYIKLISDLFEPEQPIELDSLRLNVPISEDVKNNVVAFIPKLKEEDGVQYILI